MNDDIGYYLYFLQGVMGDGGEEIDLNFMTEIVYVIVLNVLNVSIFSSEAHFICTMQSQNMKTNLLHLALLHH